MQGKDCMPVQRMQMQEHMGKLWVRMQWRFALHEGTWYMHKYVFFIQSYMCNVTVSLLLNCDAHAELINQWDLLVIVTASLRLNRIWEFGIHFPSRIASSKLTIAIYAINLDITWHTVMLIGYLVCSGNNGATGVGWNFLWVIFFGLVAAGIAGYAVYKYRIRVSH